MRAIGRIQAATNAAAVTVGRGKTDLRLDCVIAPGGSIVKGIAIAAERALALHDSAGQLPIPALRGPRVDRRRIRAERKIVREQRARWIDHEIGGCRRRAVSTVARAIGEAVNAREA